MCFVNTNESTVNGLSWEAAHAARIGKEVQRLRGKRPASWLASRAEELGMKMTRQTVTDLENGRRRYVTTAELAVIAAALNTTPVALAYPEPYDGELIEVIPGVRIPKLRALQWFSGLSSLPLTDPGAREEYRRNVRQLGAARAIWELEIELSELVIPEEGGPRREQALERVSFLQRQIDALKSARRA
jgi:transcriptional regulator with XRE-family HTH domain